MCQKCRAENHEKGPVRSKTRKAAPSPLPNTRGRNGFDPHEDSASLAWRSPERSFLACRHGFDPHEDSASTSTTCRGANTGASQWLRSA